MIRPLFVAVSDGMIAQLISGAKKRVIVAMPGIREQAAKALVAARGRLGADAVVVILDCEEEVFRLGYGDLQSLLHLRDAGFQVRQAPALRIGVVVRDDEGYVFAPTALYVASEVQSDETPNAIRLTGEAVAELVETVVPPEPRHVANEPATGSGNTPPPEPEIGVSPISEEAVAKVQEALEIAPPIAFDIARTVRVFQPYIQYVEISLRGCAIERRRLTIPDSIQHLGPGTELEGRLRTTFDLIEKSSEISSGSLNKKLNKIRDDLTPSLGEPWGRVMLRSARERLDKRIEEFEAHLDAHRDKVKRDLEKVLGDSRRQIVEYYRPLIRENPPDVLVGQLTRPPNDKDIDAWLQAELDDVFPTAADLTTDMIFDVQYRDVTYETLNDPGFFDSLRKAFPRVNWDRPFDEFNAAREG
jgi:hypothetical protein